MMAGAGHSHGKKKRRKYHRIELFEDLCSLLICIFIRLYIAAYDDEI